MLILSTIKNNLKAQSCIYNCISSLFCLLVIFSVPEINDCYHWLKSDIRLQRLGSFPYETVATHCSYPIFSILHNFLPVSLMQTTFTEI